ncbi:hypothetical protein VP1G_04431 [Cytospora mali]|uniref:Uncharacterized protein n=1 Tax=Cytospora mali TaxID=578113 RepID=A0A194UZR3_CYTMA|nr:hypothetical protein VP1G_04431 [Valsa mali var. pyri (nom. inval.)]
MATSFQPEIYSNFIVIDNRHHEFAYLDLEKDGKLDKTMRTKTRRHKPITILDLPKDVRAKIWSYVAATS